MDAFRFWFQMKLVATTSDIWVLCFFVRCVALRFSFPAPSSCWGILLCMCCCGSERIVLIVEDYEEMESWRNVKRGNTWNCSWWGTPELFRWHTCTDVASVVKMWRGICTHPVSFKTPVSLGLRQRNVQFLVLFLLPSFEIGLQLQEGWEVSKFSLKSRLPTSETLIVIERGFTHVWRGIGLFKALSRSHQFRWQSVSLQGINFEIRCWEYSVWVKKT